MTQAQANNEHGIPTHQRQIACRDTEMARMSPAWPERWQRGVQALTGGTPHRRFGSARRFDAFFCMWLSCNNPLKKITDPFAALSVWDSYARLCI